MPDQVLVGVQDRILTIRLNRPEKKNALTFEMYTGLTEALTKADGDPAVHVVLITGAPDCFTAGNDLADFAAAKPGQVSPAIGYLETLAAAFFLRLVVTAALGAAGCFLRLGTRKILVSGHLEEPRQLPSSRSARVTGCGCVGCGTRYNHYLG